MRRVRTVVFDCGETLVDETTQWSVWASWLGVPAFTLIAALGGVLERGRPFKDVFALFDPSFDIDAEIERRGSAGETVPLDRSVLHPDVVPAMEELRSAGYRLVIAGTMTLREHADLDRLGLPVQAILSHTDLGARNAAPGFFTALLERIHSTVEDALYVSHRLDTAGRAAGAAGMRFLYLQRGPIAYLRLGSAADLAVRERIVRLTELPAMLAEAASTT